MNELIWLLAGALAGYPLGLLTNFVIGKVFEYRSFIHTAIYEVRLLSGILQFQPSARSADFDRIPRADASVRLCADQCDHLKQVRIADRLRRIETEITARFEEAQIKPGTEIDINEDKRRWISEMESLKPDWFTFIRT